MTADSLALGAYRGLVPAWHRTAEFYVCGIFEAAAKDDLGSMEHRVFSLAAKE